MAASAPAPDFPDNPATSPISYEAARDELSRIVTTLESGGLTLDESLVLWERGEELARVCERFLDGARTRVDAALARADEGNAARSS